MVSATGYPVETCRSNNNTVLLIVVITELTRVTSSESCFSQQKVFLWSLRSYTFMRHLTYDHERSMASCDFSQDGALLAVASYHSTTGWWLDLWDPYTADLLTRVEYVGQPILFYHFIYIFYSFTTSMI